MRPLFEVVIRNAVESVIRVDRPSTWERICIKRLFLHHTTRRAFGLDNYLVHATPQFHTGGQRHLIDWNSHLCAHLTQRGQTMIISRYAVFEDASVGWKFQAERADVWGL